MARHLQVSWEVIKDIQKRYLGQRYARPKLKKLHQLAVDEIAIGKGHRYLTIVLDLAGGNVVYVGEGKGAEALKSFWERLKLPKPRSKPWPRIWRQPISRQSSKTSLAPS